MQPVVHLRSAVCLLGRFPALAGVDLDVAAGEVVLLSGGNGAGKTTLLRMVAGLVAPHTGTAEVFGYDLTHDRVSHRRLLALVGHETACYDDLSVEENLRFAARGADASVDGVEVVLGQFGLERLSGVLHRKLSAGQRRRLALAAALVRDPRLLLLDEPHAGLDAEGRAVLDDVLQAAAGEGRAVLLASHELDRARALAHREVVLVAGQADGAVASPPESDGHPEETTGTKETVGA